MLQAREYHLRVRQKVLEALGDRSWKWLSEQSGVPQSTLSTQVTRPRFSIEVLLRLAAALEKDVSFFLIAETPSSSAEDAERSKAAG